MYEPTAAWSLPEQLFQVSERTANDTQHDQPSSGTHALLPTPHPPNVRPTRLRPRPGGPIHAWTDLTYLLHQHRVSWGYYVVTGTEPDCQNDAALSCSPVRQNAVTASVWNPLPLFDTVNADHQRGNIKSITSFYSAAKNGDLPAVSWIVPSGSVSGHPPWRIIDGVP